MSPVKKLSLVVVLLAGCFTMYRRCNHWELAIHERHEGLSLTFRERCGNRVQTVILDGIRGSNSETRSYRLPDDVGEINGALLKFSDITMRPGRVTFTFFGHSFDVMERALFIDGDEHSWNTSGEVHLKSPNKAVERRATCYLSALYGRRPSAHRSPERSTLPAALAHLRPLGHMPHRSHE